VCCSVAAGVEQQQTKQNKSKRVERVQHHCCRLEIMLLLLRLNFEDRLLCDVSSSFFNISSSLKKSSSSSSSRLPISIRRRRRRK
jgi:hypothetical protein